MRQDWRLIRRCRAGATISAQFLRGRTKRIAVTLPALWGYLECAASRQFFVGKAKSLPSRAYYSAHITVHPLRISRGLNEHLVPLSLSENKHWRHSFVNDLTISQQRGKKPEIDIFAPPSASAINCANTSCRPASPICRKYPSSG